MYLEVQVFSKDTNLIGAGILDSERVEEWLAGAPVSVCSRWHPPASLARSEPAHLDGGGVWGSSPDPQQTHQWADLSLHGLP